MRYQKISGIPSELLFDQQPLEQNVNVVVFVNDKNQKLFQMTKEIKEQIFRQFPEVEYAYKKEVPANRGEVPFWTLFFRFYVADLREDALLGGCNNVWFVIPRS